MVTQITLCGLQLGCPPKEEEPRAHHYVLFGQMLDRPTRVNRELIAAEGVTTGLGPPLGGAWVVCRFGMFLIDKSALPIPSGLA